MILVENLGSFFVGTNMADESGAAMLAKGHRKIIAFVGEVGTAALRVFRFRETKNAPMKFQPNLGIDKTNLNCCESGDFDLK